MTTVSNGVNLEALGGFVEAVKNGAVSPDIRFTAKSRWTGGTRTEVTIDQFSAGGVNAAPTDRSFKLVVDEPAALGGQDTAPNPVEYLAAGLCGCITAGIVTNAAMFGTNVEGLEVTVDADINVLGLFGLDRSVPSHCSRITYTVKLRGSDEAALRKSKEVIDGKSPVRNTLANAIEIVTHVV
jgi:uncharacterized OsmC-like protein